MTQIKLASCSSPLSHGLAISMPTWKGRTYGRGLRINSSLNPQCDPIFKGSSQGVHFVRDLGPVLGKNARFFASLESDADKTDGARKALEQAFQGKGSVAKKWEEEIKKRELAAGDGGSGGRGGGGGGGDGRWGGGDEDMGEGFDEEEPWDWDEVGQRTMATVVLIFLYCSITNGPKQILNPVKVFIRYVRQGFRLRKIPEEYLVPWSDSEDEYDVELEGTESPTITAEGEVDVRGPKRRVQANGKVLESHQDVPSLPPPPSTQRSLKGDDVRSRREREKQQQLHKLMTPQQRKQMEEREQ